jgi:hypothetical protein
MYQSRADAGRRFLIRASHASIIARASGGAWIVPLL